jgi:hypothetical protein
VGSVTVSATGQSTQVQLTGIFPDRIVFNSSHQRYYLVSPEHREFAITAERRIYPVKTENRGFKL